MVVSYVMLCLLSISQANEVYRTYCPVTEITPVPRREIFTATWPNGCIGIDIDTGAVRQVCSFNAWHPSINRQGTLMCTDTTFPDIGLQLFDPRDGVGDPRPLCFPEASSEGGHWDTDHCPYDDEDYQQGKWTVYAPQHTHPHPAFSPDGKHVVFTSDRTGHAQVYVVTLPAVRALRRRPDLLVVLLPDILLYRELHPYEPLHAARIQWRNEIERDISSLFERDQNETLNEIYNETKLIRLLLTGKGAITHVDRSTRVTEQSLLLTHRRPSFLFNDHHILCARLRRDSKVSDFPVFHPPLNHRFVRGVQLEFRVPVLRPSRHQVNLLSIRL